MLVVTSVYKDRYDNILNFCLKYGLDLIVYNKNDSLKLDEEIITKKTDHFTIIDIPNYGRCDYSFLYYIIKHYSALPDKILFTKANFMDQTINLENSIHILDYKFLLMGKHLKYGIFNKDYDINKLFSRGIRDYDIERLFQTRDTINDPCFQSYTTLDFYKMVYGDKIPPKDEILNFGHGPSFCVYKELILAHSLEVYKRLLDTFYPNKGHWTKWVGYSENEQYLHLGKRYHDNLLRFWMVLFVQNYSTNNIRTDYRNYCAINI